MIFGNLSCGSNILRYCYIEQEIWWTELVASVFYSSFWLPPVHGFFLVNIHLGFGSCYIGLNTLEPCQIYRFPEQSCNNILLHVHMEGNQLHKLNKCRCCKMILFYFLLWSLEKKFNFIHQDIYTTTAFWSLSTSIYPSISCLCSCSSFMPSTCSYHL